MEDKLALSHAEIEALKHRLAMYQQLTSIYPMEHTHLQKQIEILLTLERFDEAELLLLQLQNILNHRGLKDDAQKTDGILKHINKEKLCQQLYSTPFLHLASSNFLEKAFRSHRRVELAEGDYLIRYGAHETQMFILVKGELAVWSRDSNDKKCYEHTMQVGEVIGELAFLDNTPRSADVIACGKATVLAIPSNAVLKLFMDSPEVEQALRRSATMRKIQMDIKESSVLLKLSVHARSLLAQSGQYKHYKPLERIYTQQQNIETIDLVCSGYVRFVGELGDGSSVMLNSLRKGNLLGCSAVVPNMEKQHTSDTVSMADTTLIQFPLDFFRKVMSSNPRLYQAILQYSESEQYHLLQTISQVSK